MESVHVDLPPTDTIDLKPTGLIAECSDDHAAALLVMPPEILAERVLRMCGCYSLGRLASTATRMRNEVDNDDVWHATFEAKWPPWNLLAVGSKHTVIPWRTKFCGRMSGMLPLNIAEGVRVLEGAARDDYDGNVVPVRAIVGLERGFAGAIVQNGTGSLHNAPTQGIWVGRYVASQGAHVESSQKISIQWEEKLRNSRSKWAYTGEVSEDGLGISGTFHFKLFPRKSGTFQLTVCASSISEVLPNMTQLSLQIHSELLALRASQQNRPL